MEIIVPRTLQWRHNGRDSVSNHLPHDCLLNRLFRRRSKKTSQLRVTGICAGNSPATGEFPAQMASNAENVFIWWRHHEFVIFLYKLWSHNNSLLFCLQFKCGMSAKTILTNVLVSGIIFHYRLYYWLNWKARAEANVKYAVCGINRVWQQNRPTKIKFWCRFQFQMTKISPNA